MGPAHLSAETRSDRSDEDDAAILLRDHCRRHGLAHKKRALEVHVEHAIPPGVVDLVDSGRVPYTSEGDQKVDAPEAPLRFGRDAPSARLVRNVNLEREAFDTAIGRFARRLFCTSEVSIRTDDMRALAREQYGGLTPHSARGPSDHTNFAFQ